MNTKDLYTISKLFEKEAQVSQEKRPNVHHPVDLLHVLSRARMMPPPLSFLTPVLNQAKVKGDTNVSIELVVAPGGVASFRTSLSPFDKEKGERIDAMLKVRFGKAIEEALRKQGAMVEQEQVLPWISLVYKAPLQNTSG